MRLTVSSHPGLTIYRLVLAGCAAFLLSTHTDAQSRKNTPPPRPPAMRPSQPRPAARAQNGKPNTPNRNQAGNANRPVNGGRPAPAANRNPFNPPPNHGPSNAPNAANRNAAGLSNNASIGDRSRFTNHTPPGRTVSLKSGGSANVRSDGKFRTIDRSGMHIDYGARGGRTVSSVRNGARIVTTGAHQGFVQRSYTTRNGHSYVQRTYVVNNVTHTVAYRSYSFRGAVYYGYAPAYYYRPAFYTWAYSPWPAPIFWSWGWTTAAYPWYGYYGSYFSPYPAYPSAAYWLTDYLVAADLQAAYAARAAANTAPQSAPADGGAQQADAGTPGQRPAALSPQVKQAITEEVKAELAREQSSAAQSQAGGGAVAQGTVPPPDDVPPALDPASRTFVVASSLDVVATDQECTLTPGDVITRLSDTPDPDQKVIASVSSSKNADCAAGKQVLVAVQDLQEMQNRFREQLDSGLRELAARQGSNGLPQAPGATQVAGEVPPPVADATAAQMLQSQEAAADQTEHEASRQVTGQGS